jgi:hypothetical protein
MDCHISCRFGHVYGATPLAPPPVGTHASHRRTAARRCTAHLAAALCFVPRRRSVLRASRCRCSVLRRSPSGLHAASPTARHLRRRSPSVLRASRCRCSVLRRLPSGSRAASPTARHLRRRSPSGSRTASPQLCRNCHGIVAVRPQRSRNSVAAESPQQDHHNSNVVTVAPAIAAAAALPHPYRSRAATAALPQPYRSHAAIVLCSPAVVPQLTHSRSSLQRQHRSRRNR